MKSNFEESKENRKAKFENLSQKNFSLSNNFYDRADQLGSVLQPGQPIQLGHHSEKGHRSLLKRIDNCMVKSAQMANKARYYERKATTARNAIFSDDPQVLVKLREKLEKHETLQELYKSVNKIIKKHGLDSGPVLIEKMKVSEKLVSEYLKPDYMGSIGIPSYELTSNGAIIRTVKKRIEQETAKSKIITASYLIGEVEIIMNAEDNRTQIKFAEKPSEEIIKELKGYGFRWSSNSGLWQRQLSYTAKRYAETILTKII